MRGELQAKVLKWGILGAIVMRLVFIFIGAALLKEFQWLFYIFGALLVYTAWKMAFSGDDEIEPDKNPLVKLARRFLPMTKRIRGDWFITRRMQIWIASPLFMVLLVVESSDLVFAMDSIPAIFAITLDPFIVLTSNIFAIMATAAAPFRADAAPTTRTRSALPSLGAFFLRATPRKDLPFIVTTVCPTHSV